MKYTEEVWKEKQRAGLVRYLLVDGIFFTGGPFALVMQIIGVFFLRDEGQTVGQYFTSTRMWMTFFAHAILFGVIIGFINWRRNQNAFGSNASNT
jgi:hypothetical protein